MEQQDQKKDRTQWRGDPVSEEATLSHMAQAVRPWKEHHRTQLCQEMDVNPGIAADPLSRTVFVWKVGIRMSLKMTHAKSVAQHKNIRNLPLVSALLKH